MHVAVPPGAEGTGNRIVPSGIRHPQPADAPTPVEVYALNLGSDDVAAAEAMADGLIRLTRWR